MTSIERAREAAAERAAQILADCFEKRARPVRDVVLEMYDGLLSALSAEGMVVVPKEATEEMCNSNDARVWLIEPERFKSQCAARVWSAMIAAASQGEGK